MILYPRTSSSVPLHQEKLIFHSHPIQKKTFNRNSAPYFISGRKGKHAELISPKSTGKFIGTVSKSTKNDFTLDTEETLHNGDGLCFIDNDQLKGIRVNTVKNNKIITREHNHPPAGTKIFRNLDIRFHHSLSQSNNCRKIALTARVSLLHGKLHLHLQDSDAIISSTPLQYIPTEKAKNRDMLKKTLLRQLVKTGDTPFILNEITIECDNTDFVPVAEINKWRRESLKNHIAARQKAYCPLFQRRQDIPNG